MASNTAPDGKVMPALAEAIPGLFDGAPNVLTDAQKEKEPWPLAKKPAAHRRRLLSSSSSETRPSTAEQAGPLQETTAQTQTQQPSAFLEQQQTARLRGQRRFDMGAMASMAAVALTAKDGFKNDGMLMHPNTGESHLPLSYGSYMDAYITHSPDASGLFFRPRWDYLCNNGAAGEFDCAPTSGMAKILKSIPAMGFDPDLVERGQHAWHGWEVHDPPPKKKGMFGGGMLGAIAGAAMSLAKGAMFVPGYTGNHPDDGRPLHPMNHFWTNVNRPNHDAAVYDGRKWLAEHAKGVPSSQLPGLRADPEANGKMDATALGSGAGEPTPTPKGLDLPPEAGHIPRSKETLAKYMYGTFP